MSGFNVNRIRNPENWEYLDTLYELPLSRTEWAHNIHLQLDSLLHEFDKNKSLSEFLAFLPDSYVAAITLDGKHHETLIRDTKRWMFLAYGFFSRFAEEFTEIAMAADFEKEVMETYEYIDGYADYISKTGFRKFLMTEYPSPYILKEIRIMALENYFPPLLQKECEKRGLGEKVKQIKMKLRTKRRLAVSRDRQKKQDIEKNKNNGVYGVYFLQLATSEALIKIGFSTNIPNRVRNIRGQIPYPIDFLASLPGADREDERSLHRKFKHLKVKGEWFRPEEELLAFIDGFRGLPNGEEEHGEEAEVGVQ